MTSIEEDKKARRVEKRREDVMCRRGGVNQRRGGGRSRVLNLRVGTVFDLAPA